MDGKAYCVLICHSEDDETGGHRVPRAGGSIYHIVCSIDIDVE